MRQERTELEELWRVAGRHTHPLDEPVALEVPAAAREAGLLDFLDPRMKT